MVAKYCNLDVSESLVIAAGAAARAAAASLEEIALTEAAEREVVGAGMEVVVAQVRTAAFASPARRLRADPVESGCVGHGQHAEARGRVRSHLQSSVSVPAVSDAEKDCCAAHAMTVMSVDQHTKVGASLNRRFRSIRLS